MTVLNQAFFMQRLNDHIQYLDKITKTLKGKQDFRGCDCHCCQLGQWIYSTAQHDIECFAGASSTQLFKELVALHERFHEVSFQALEAYEQHDEVNSYRSMTEMQKASGQLVNLLLALDRLARRSSAELAQLR